MTTSTQHAHAHRFRFGRPTGLTNVGVCTECGATQERMNAAPDDYSPQEWARMTETGHYARTGRLGTYQPLSTGRARQQQQAKGKGKGKPS